MQRGDRLKCRAFAGSNDPKPITASDSDELSEAQFEQFVLPHLSRGRRGPAPTLPLCKIFNYILQALYMGCQWKMLPIQTNAQGLPEIHHTRIYRMMRRWQADGSIDRVFAGSVGRLHDDQLLDLDVIHGDGTTTAAKKGGDNLGYSGHNHLKGDKVLAFCDRQCNIIAPFVTAPGNRNESPLLRDALPELSAMARAIGADLQGSTVSLDGVYDCRANRKVIFNRGMVPNIPENPRGRKTPKRGRRQRFDPAIFEERFRTIERVFAWEDTFRRLLLRFERISDVHYALKTLAYTMINLRHYCRN
ncbi:transposase [Paraburkholderia sp. 35.1]|uniref:transposase n=1 Tax=Paraburkholderia sp. 35.1 TaxID=2991058 RepID=UPI003D232EC6